MEEYSRLSALISQESVEKLQTKKVAIFGIGGVGGYVCEAFARCGIGEFLLVDFDTVSLSNINRQIIALHSTIGKEKTELMKTRILDINNQAKVETLDICVNSENIEKIDFSKYDFVVDAIDMVSAKLLLIENAKKCNVPIISCMGTGNKLDLTKLRIEDISKSSYCPLAKVMRKELKDRNITDVPVLYSVEQPQKTSLGSTPASMIFVPATAGLMIAKYVCDKFLEE